MKKLRMGVFGCGRGRDLAKNFMMLNCDIAAVCDFHPDRLNKAVKALGRDVAAYTDFDSFLSHGLDAVILANYFNEHAPYAVKCLEKGIHVYSECISNGTMAEGVELVRAFEKSNALYMLAENYPQMKFNREMTRICRGGTLGKVVYAEGEYNHPGDQWDVEFKREHNYFPTHWRNFLPRTYYITHSLGPIMHATGAAPKRVTAFAPFAPIEDGVPTASRVGDRAAIVTTLNDDGSVFRVTGCASFGGHHNSYRVCGTEGQIENLRGMGERVMLRYNDWSKPENAEEINCYEPGWNDRDEELIKNSGHGGSDYLTARTFVECIKANKQPEHPFDVYSATAMASVAILAHRSMLAGGAPVDIPDLRLEADREKYQNDRLSPFYAPDGTAPTLPCCSVRDFAPTEKQMSLYKEVLGI